MDTEVLWRVVVAAVLAATIGVEREASHQPAGLRTHVTVAIGACLFGVISTLGFTEFETVRANTNVQIDVTRVASNVVVGIGFLGAGLIFRRGSEVKNLTTAASLWATAAVGLAAGVGNEGAAAITTAALLVTLVALRPVRRLIARSPVRQRRRIRVQLAEGAEVAPVIAALGDATRGVVGGLEIHKVDGAPVIEAQLQGRHGDDLAAVYAAMARRPDVVAVTDPLVE
jgi:putative Mg2+ transporter-C (MgtC) family protein